LLTALLAAFLAAVVFWFLCNAAGALVVYRFTDPSQARDLDREASVAWWLQYVAYPACCGAAMILIALATFGRPRRQPRLNVNLMAALAVLFFIVMTAWGLAK